MIHFDLDGFLQLPWVSDLAISPDGSRLVTSVALPSSNTTVLGFLDRHLDRHLREIDTPLPELL